MISPVTIVAYLALFVAVGFAFLFVNLLIGRLLRPNAPNPEKLEIYECGEPTIGSSFLQFDLRFYVVALLFIIFEVELAFFFPWATVNGKAVQLMDSKVLTYSISSAEQEALALEPAPTAAQVQSIAAENYNQIVQAKYLELGIPAASRPQATAETLEATDAQVRNSAKILAQLSIADIALFFAILLVGFAYVWRRGDLEWVRAVVPKRVTAKPQLPA